MFHIIREVEKYSKLGEWIGDSSFAYFPLLQICLLEEPRVHSLVSIFFQNLSNFRLQFSITFSNKKTNSNLQVDPLILP